MSKNRSHVRQSRGRDTNVISNRRLPSVLSLSRSYQPIGFTSLREFEDRRYYHPSGRFAPARSFSHSRHRLVSPNRGLNSRSNPHLLARPSSINAIAFGIPDRVLICVRRKIRKEVIHALGLAGVHRLYALGLAGGSGGQKRPRLTEYSRISC